jgi:hypothetical protein
MKVINQMNVHAMHNKILSLLFFLMSFALFSCDDDFLNNVIVDQVTDDQWWKNMEQFEMFINGAYNEYTFGWASGTAWPIAGNHPLGDFIYEYPVRYDSYFEPNVGNHWVLWEFHYRVVNKMNMLLSKTHFLKDKNEKIRIEAEAHFIRGFSFLMLHRSFGKINIRLEAPNASAPSNYPRDEIEAVRKQIISDLTFAVDNLPETWNDWRNLNYDVGRPLNGSALAYRMLAHMYNEDYKNAIKDFEAIDQSSHGYGLLNNYRDVFALKSENSIESFFEIQYQGPVAAWERPMNTHLLANQCHSKDSYSYSFVKDGGYSFFFISNEFANSFENKDLRRKTCIIGAAETFVGELFKVGEVYEFDKLTAVPPTGYLCTKYWVGLEEKIKYGSNLNLVQLRYADAVLNYAECLAREGNLSAAYQQLNRIRTRAGLENLSGTNFEIFMDNLTMERRHECFAEPNVWFDLVRSGMAEKTLKESYNITMKPQWKLLPITQREVDVNNLMDQNPGY